MEDWKVGKIGGLHWLKSVDHPSSLLGCHLSFVMPELQARAGMFRRSAARRGQMSGKTKPIGIEQQLIAESDQKYQADE